MKTEIHIQNAPIFDPQFAFNHYRFMAREEIKAARFLKKHQLNEMANQCVRNALTFKKASFHFKKH